MGDHYEGSCNNIGDTEVKHVVTAEAYSEDWSRMHNSPIVEEAGAPVKSAAIEEYHGEEEAYSHDGEWYYYEGQWYSHNWDSGMQVTEVVATTSDRADRQVHSASAVDKNLSLSDETSSSSSSSEDAKVKAKSKSKKKGMKGQLLDHLQESDLDAHSDPGNAGSYYESDHARRQSVNRVSSWLQDASFGEHPNDSVPKPQHARGMPRRAPPPPVDMAAHSDPSRRASSPFLGDRGDEGHSTVSEAQYYDKTPAYNSADYGYDHEQDQLAVIPGPATANQVALESVYRLEAKPMDKARKFANNIASGFAGWSRTAAIASKKTAVIVRDKTIEITNLAVPVLAPLMNAVLDEGKDQLMGPDPGRGRAAPIGGRRGRGPGRGPGPGPGRGAGGRGPGRGPGPGPGRGAGGRGPGRGPGRGQPGPMAMVRPTGMTWPGMMQAGPWPGFATRPGMRPSMSNPYGPRLAMRPGMPGHPMAPPRPNMIARPPPQYGGVGGSHTGAPATRDPRVPMRGQPRPMGPGRGRSRPAAPSELYPASDCNVYST